VRRWLICVLMMTALLSGCAGQPRMSKAEELALTVRGAYLEMTQWTGKTSITADYGRRVYQYELAAAGTEAETVLTITAPEEAAGITARLTGTDSVLEYDGLSLETGTLNEDGLTPVSAIPALLEAARSGYITACSLEAEDTLVRVECGDPELPAGSGTVTTLWFDAASGALVRGEIAVDGFRAILCEWTDFVYS